MSKRIIIVGGGISGLNVLHQLKKTYAHDTSVSITLFEKNSYLGGTAHTQYFPEYAFEEGANGFLDSRESMKTLVSELGLAGELIQADPASKVRFICIDKQLVKVPTDPVGMLKFPKLSVLDKLRIAAEIFLPRSDINNETIYAFAKRRLGDNFAKYFIDPMVTGIFGGQAEELVLRYAFPKMYELEQTYGSLFKAMIAIKKQNKGKEKITGEPKGNLTSLRRGMSQLTESLAKKYSAHIKVSTVVVSVRARGQQWDVETTSGRYEADQVFICTPAYGAAEILKGQDEVLTQALSSIHYAPIAVVGCLFKRADLARIPQGFGYLIPASEKRNVLGVLFDTNLFPTRTADDYFLIRLMLGGARRPYAVSKSEKELTAMAQEELTGTLGISADPHKVSIKVWPHAIPQYNREYVKNLATINTCLSQIPGLYLVSNYLGGVSLNDCTTSALQAVKQSVGK